MSEDNFNEYWVDITTTYKVIANSAEEAFDLVEAFEDGDEQAKGKVVVKDQSREIEEGL